MNKVIIDQLKYPVFNIVLPLLECAFFLVQTDLGTLRVTVSVSCYKEYWDTVIKNITQSKAGVQF